MARISPEDKFAETCSLELLSFIMTEKKNSKNFFLFFFMGMYM